MSTQSPSADVPQHVAIIMDGNGRWARAKNLPRTLGHKKGAEVIEHVLDAAKSHGVKYITLYAFSSENWQRPEKEIGDLMGLLRHYLDKELKKLMQHDVKLQIIGDRSRLDDDINAKIDAAEEKTKDGSLVLTMALSYGGRQEITHAVTRMAGDVLAGDVGVSDIDEDKVASYLYTHTMPDPDLLIRTAGEQRISNFLLWQMAYTEFYFTDVLWPDFKETDFALAIEAYQQRERRYGTA